MIKVWDLLLYFLSPIVAFIGRVGMPKRKITGKHYFEIRDNIEIGTVLLSKANYELSNLINPTEIKHAAIYVGNIAGGKVKYVAEAVGKGVVLTDLVTFLTTKDIILISKPKFIRNKSEFENKIVQSINTFLGIPYDYLFRTDGKAFYCFELVATTLKAVYPEIQLKCREIIKGKRIYDENTFLDSSFFDVIFDSRSY